MSDLRKNLIVGVIAGAASALMLALVWRARDVPAPLPAAAPLPPEWTTIEVYVPKRPPRQAMQKEAPFPTTRPAAALLLDKILLEIDMRDSTIEQALERVQSETGVNMVVDWQTLERAGVQRTDPAPSVTLRQVSAAAVLRTILSRYDAVPLGYSIRDDILTVTIEDELSQIVETRLYDIRDLLLEAAKFRVVMAGPTTRPSRFWPNSGNNIFGFVSTSRHPDTQVELDLVDDLKAMITNSISINSWVEHGGRQGVIRYWGGRLLVTQTPDAQQAVSNLLDLLRDEQLQDPVNVPR